LPANSSRRLPARLALCAGRLAVVIVALSGSACSVIGAREQVRGNMVDLDSLKELVPGTSTRADVTTLIGSPSAKASFDESRWIYIGEVTQPRIASTQAVVKQKVVVLTFDEKGVLREVKQLGQKDSLPVDVIARTTPTPGGHASIFQQIFGNVGKFGPGLGSNAGPTGGLLGPSP
jgi:outer membrane protein assembly factor BamE (lipoprotein component of BamABCDE complex)